MKPYQLIIIGIALLCLMPGIASAFSTPESIAASAKVYVSNVTYSPGSFYPGDEGTVTIKVTNGDATEGIVVSHATLQEDNLKFTVTSPPFTTSTNIGPGQTQTFVFTIKADSMGEGIAYPIFSLSFRDADSLWYRTSVWIEDAPLELTITDRPDTFTNGGKDTVKVTVWNPRETSVRSVNIIPAGTGITTTPIKGYVGDLGAGASKEVTFEITPSQETDLTFTAVYFNGINEHKASETIPVIFGTDKLGAQLVVNNIESSVSGGTTTLKGDVTNNGLTDANSVLVTVGSPANPVNPNPVYAIGNLEPDDFSSFEVTYTTTGNSAVPIQVEYKDEDGNIFEEKFTFTANGNADVGGSASLQNVPSGARTGTSVNPGGGMFGSFGSGINKIPVTEIVIGVIAIIVLLVAWKKGLLRRLANKFRKEPRPESPPRER
jgi:hypothetical protein